MEAPATASHGAIVYTNTLVETAYIGNTSFIQDPYACGDLIKQCCCPCMPWVTYTGHTSDAKEMKLGFSHPCLACPCCCDWTATTSIGGQQGKTGELKPAGCCDNGFVNACCPCLKTGPVVEMKFSIDDNNKYSTRRNLGPIDCFYKCCGMSTCRLCLPCTFCLKFGCDDTPYRVQTMPFYGESGEDVNAEDGQAPIGEFVFVDQLKPIMCCCVPWGVKNSIRMISDIVPDQNEVVLLALYSQVAKGLPVVNPCTMALSMFSGVPMPIGNDWADVGMNTTTRWLTTGEMMAETAANDQESQAAAIYDPWGGQA